LSFTPTTNPTRFKELLCVNTSEHHEIKVVVTGKAKNYDCLNALKQKVCLFITTSREEHEWVSKKLVPEVHYFLREMHCPRSSAAVRQCIFSSQCSVT
jgi:hypothetical protein